MISWGLVMTLMGIVQNYAGLLTARIFLGVTEAGLFPGVAVCTYPPWSAAHVADHTTQYYLTMWYCRHEIQLRTALFFSAASIAGAFSGLLAFGIAKMDGIGGLEGWRWIFIIEGILTVVVAVFAFFALYDFPETAGFLTQEERDFIAFRLKYQGQGKPHTAEDSDGSSPHVQVAQAEEFAWKYVWQAVSDWQIWVNILVCWGVSILAFMPS